MTKEAKCLILIGFMLAIALLISLSACCTHQYNMPQTESPKAKQDSINTFNKKSHAINLL